MKHLWLSSFCIILITSSCYCSQENELTDWENIVVPEQIHTQQALKTSSASIERKPLWGFPVINKIRSSFSSNQSQNTSTQAPVLPAVDVSSIPVKNLSNNSFLVVENETSSTDTSSTQEIQIVTLDTLKKVKSIEANLESASSATTDQIKAVTALLSHIQKTTVLENMISSNFTDETSNTEITDAPSSPIHSRKTTEYNSYQSSGKTVDNIDTTTTHEQCSFYELCCGCCIKKKAVNIDNVSESRMSNDDPKKKAELIELTNMIDAMVRI